MSIATVADLAKALRAFRLLTPPQLDKLESLLCQFSSPHSLARKLIDSNYLTPYQMNQLFQFGMKAELMIGPYVLMEKIGEGGMGQVFKARNTKMNRFVALKVIRKERLDKPETVQRFYREVRAAAQLTHSNVVLAYDADEVNGTHFFAMEYVDGPNLAKLVKDCGRLPIETACEYMRQAACGLAHAHERGVVHRDIKPSNILVASGGRKPPVEHPATAASTPGLPPPFAMGMVKILDMGLARACPTGADSASDLTQEGALMGTPDYIAPEQMLDARSVDIRADLYSLGCTFYFVLTGSAPFPGGSLGEKLLKHQLHYPTPVEQLRVDAPPSVVAVVNRLMAKRAEDRFQSPAELVAVLESVQAAMLVAATPAPLATPIGPANDPNVLADWAAMAVPAMGPSSRPGLGNAPPSKPTARASEDTMAGRSSVLDNRVRPGSHLPIGSKKFLLLGLAIGGGVGVLLIAVLFLFVFSGSPDNKNKGTNQGSPGKSAENARQPVFLTALPELDVQVWDKGFSKNGMNHEGQKLMVKGAAPKAVLYLHPTENGKAQIVYRLDKKYKEFQAGIAIADTATPNSLTPLTFVVSADGWVLWKSTPMQNPGEVQQCIAPVNDRTLLKLEVLCPGTHNFAHAVWIDPQLK